MLRSSTSSSKVDAANSAAAPRSNEEAHWWASTGLDMAGDGLSQTRNVDELPRPSKMVVVWPGSSRAC